MEKEIVLCPSKETNGEQCGYELLSKFKRCPMCEVRVDKAWFQCGKQNHLQYFLHEKQVQNY